MSSLDNLGEIAPDPPPGVTPGLVLDGDTGYVTTKPTGDNHADVAAVLKAAQLNPDDFVVDWARAARITVHLDAAGNLVQRWLKFPIDRKPQRAFNVQELVDTIHTPVRRVRKPKSQDVLTIMLSDQHIGKSAEAGGGADMIIERWKQSVSRALVGGTRRAINLVFGGDTIEGYISQGGKNINETDLVLSEQLQVAQQMVSWTIQQALPLAREVHVSVVPGNHAETTRVQNVPIGDNFDVMIVKNVEQAMKLAGLDDRISFHYPTMVDGSVTYEVCGTRFTVAHGHKFKGQMKGAENWWAGHIANGRHPKDSHILLSGHFHNFQASNWTRDRWILFAPSLENESTWFANSTGSTSLPGALVFTSRDGIPMGICIV